MSYIALFARLQLIPNVHIEIRIILFPSHFIVKKENSIGNASSQSPLLLWILDASPITKILTSSIQSRPSFTCNDLIQ